MPIPSHAKPFNRSIIREEVYKTLLTWIMEGELRPGEKLLDKELADYMGVSRTPVREALRRLEDKGLVETAANRWTRVTVVPINEPEMIYPIIYTLEELAVSQAFENLNESEFEVMGQANKELSHALKNNDPVKASQADFFFHDVFIRSTGNPHLIDLLHDLKVKSRRIEVNYFEGCASAEHSIVEHSQILDALRNRDIVQAQSSIRTNWQSSLKRLKDIKNKETIDT